MSKPRASTFGIPVAVIVAVAITVGLVWLLSMLNNRSMPEPITEQIRTVMIRTETSQAVQRPQPVSQPEPRPQLPEQMTAVLKPPTPPLLAPPPLALDLELPRPEIDPVEIAIYHPPVEPQEITPAELTLAKAATDFTPDRTMQMVRPRPALEMPDITRAQTEATPHNPTTTKTVARSQTDPTAVAATEVVSVHKPAVRLPDLTPPKLELSKATPESTPTRTAHMPSVAPLAVAPEVTRSQVDRTAEDATGSTRSIARSQTASAAPTTSSRRASVGSTVRRSDQVDQPPRESFGNAQPTYPVRERNLGIEASVLVKLLIDEEGRVQDAKVLRGPEAFRRSVLAVAYDWQFVPARHEGRSVKVWGVKEVRFQLRRQ